MYTVYHIFIPMPSKDVFILSGQSQLIPGMADQPMSSGKKIDKKLENF